MIDFEPFRKDFERLHPISVSCGHQRSRKGNYLNPSLSRDWKWFCYGLLTMHRDVEYLQKELNRARA